MDPKETKLILKEVREAIKSEKYAEAVNKCEHLIENDPKNYLAHLLLGAAYQTIDKTQASKSLKKAINLSPGPPTIALQGLANCASVEELPKIYEQLLQLLPENSAGYYNKLLKIAEKPSVSEECFKILKKAALGVIEDNENRKLALKCLALLWVANDYEHEGEELLYKTALESAIADREMPEHLTLNKRYLKLLYKLKDYGACIKNACHIVTLYPNDIYAYEWICKIYCETYNMPTIAEPTKSTNADVLAELEAPITHYAKTLLSLNENSGLAFLVEAIKCYEQHEFIPSRALLQRALLLQPNYSVALALLARIHMELGAYGMALPIWRRLNQFDVEYAVCLSHYETEKELLQQAVALLLVNEPNEQILNSLARCYTKLGQLDKLRELPLDDATKAEFVLSPTEAIKFFQTGESETLETFHSLFLCGKLYLQIGNYADSLTCLLKATRLQPHRADCFFHLAQIYRATKDIVRAQKCYEKCLHLNPVCEEAVKNLSAIYQQRGEEDLNVALLLNTLKHIPTERSKHTHYKLGLHFLNTRKWDDAIQSFRTAIKLDVNCLIYWESLGDAYAERGSYNSAIRVFQKILELESTQQYAQLQIALIKTTIRMYSEAIEDFNNLLRVYPNYLPGLKGCAEAHIGLAHTLKLEHRYGRCKVHLQLAVNHLQSVFLNHASHAMVWLWRLTGYVFLQTAQMPTSLANLDVSGELAKRDTEVAFLTRRDLLQLATRFYTCALKLKQTTFLWYELAVCSYLTADYIPEDAQKHLELAASACKMAIKEQSNRWHNWNLFGVINMHKANRNLPIAQHCFVQALTLERKSYTTWTNLGVLYLQLKEIKLANQAFQRAQQSSPIYPQAWIGQAMIAEEIADAEEALDLFRHCQQFEYHAESALGYVHWVCQMLVQMSEKGAQPNHKHAIERMHADIVALDAINWYVRNEEDAATISGLTYQGLLNVRLGHNRSAVRAYLQAIKNSTISVAQERDKILTNLGYLYLKLQQPLEAINAFDSVAHASAKGIIGLALAYFRAGQHQQSYEIYNSMLQSVSGSNIREEIDKAASVLVAMAAMVYDSQGEADTKTILYQCILLENTPIEALFSACALGILHRDNQLSATILRELKKHESSFKHSAEIAFITAQYYLSNGQPLKGLTYILQRLHIFPHNAGLREVLANYLLDNFQHKQQYHVATSQIALGAIHLNHLSKSKRSDCTKDAKSLIIASRALSFVDKAHSSKLLQRALHINPENKQAWSTLLDAH